MSAKLRSSSATNTTPKENGKSRMGWLKKSTSSFKLKEEEPSETRIRSFTLSASTSNVDSIAARREQFAHRTKSEPVLPKTIDEVWDEVIENWDEVYNCALGSKVFIFVF